MVYPHLNFDLGEQPPEPLARGMLPPETRKLAAEICFLIFRLPQFRHFTGLPPEDAGTIVSNRAPHSWH